MIICKPSSLLLRPPPQATSSRGPPFLLRPLLQLPPPLPPPVEPPSCRPPLRSCPPFDYVIPLASPAPDPLIIFTRRRSDSPAPGGPIPFTFHYELATIPAIEPATLAFFSPSLPAPSLSSFFFRPISRHRSLVQRARAARARLRRTLPRAPSPFYARTPWISVNGRCMCSPRLEWCLGISACVLDVPRATGVGLSSPIIRPRGRLDSTPATGSVTRCRPALAASGSSNDGVDLIEAFGTAFRGTVQVEVLLIRIIFLKVGKEGSVSSDPQGNFNSGGRKGR